VPRSVWQRPTLIAHQVRGLIHPAPGRHFDHVFATCQGVGASYFSQKAHGLVFQRFYCHYVVTYREQVSADDCTGTIVLFGRNGILQARLTGDRCK
jgi:hypothetical protein